jgi:hypothetical protein
VYESDSRDSTCEPTLKDVKKKKDKKDVVKATTVNTYVADSLAGVELFVNTLSSGPIPSISVVDTWGYDGDHDSRALQGALPRLCWCASVFGIHPIRFDALIE